MQCFSLQLIEQLLIWGVIFGAGWAIINLLLPLATSFIHPIIIQICRIIFFAFVAIVILMFIFNIGECMFSAFPGGLLPHR